jgi:hypothetical protein
VLCGPLRGSRGSRGRFDHAAPAVNRALALATLVTAVVVVGAQ